jgi:bifunctional ADP-heptose synthase (sugar kinase/adenylyltransferase)
VLVVAVESDERIRSGVASYAAGGVEAARPVTPAAERAEIVAALACVDCAVIFEGPHEPFLTQLAPDIFVQGGLRGSGASGNASTASSTRPLYSRRASDLPGSSSLSSTPNLLGASRVVRIPLEPGFSTAGLIERIARRRT